MIKIFARLATVTRLVKANLVSMYNGQKGTLEDIKQTLAASMDFLGPQNISVASATSTSTHTASDMLRTPDISAQETDVTILTIDGDGQYYPVLPKAAKHSSGYLTDDIKSTNAYVVPDDAEMFAIASAGSMSLISPSSSFYCTIPTHPYARSAPSHPIKDSEHRVDMELDYPQKIAIASVLSELLERMRHIVDDYDEATEIYNTAIHQPTFERTFTVLRADFPDYILEPDFDHAEVPYIIANIRLSYQHLIYDPSTPF